MNAVVSEERKPGPILRALREGVEVILELFFPAHCINCEDALFPGEVAICDSCAKQIVLIKDDVCIRCGMKLSYGFGPKITCADCIRDSGFEMTCAVAMYSGPWQTLVQRWKFGRCQGSTRQLASMIVHRIKALGLEDEFDVITHVPMIGFSWFFRGFDHTQTLAKHIAFEMLKPHERLLAKVRKTKKQSSLNKANRLKNLKGAFRAAGEVKGKRVLLIDDIVTTCATAKECSNTLLKAGARQVVVAALARAALDKN
ncbi:MAG: double zinc ribbon domain-containing protein [Planctomycetes bacterium]|nr:double zinc ribbon domain-containing protein [Planctomycetota bacterium]